MNNFSVRLKELRGEKGLSQNKLAKLTGLTQVSISLWESKKKNPSIDAVIILAKFFNVTTDYLLGVVDY